MTKIQTLGTILTTAKGRKPKLLHDAPLPGLVPYIDISAVEQGTQRQWADPKESKVIPAGSLVMVWDGARSGWVGLTKFEGALGSTLAVLESPLNQRFLAAFLRGHFADINSNHRGSGIPHVNPDYLRNLDIPIVSELEQLSIADLTEAAAEMAGSTGSHLAAARRAIERFRQAVLAAACCGRLTGDWREQNHCGAVEPGPPLSSQAAANASSSPNTDELAEIPDTWAWWPVEAITERVIDYRGRTPPSGGSGTIPHVRTTQIRGGRIDWQTDRFVSRDVYDAYMTRGIPVRDDVLFTMEAPLGEVGIVDRDEPFSIAQRILLMRPGDQVIGAFLALSLRSHPVRRSVEYRATGSGVLGIAYKRLRSVLLPVPTIEEQAEIVRRVDRLFVTADGLQKRIELASSRVDRSSQAVLAKAFRGDLTVDRH